MKPQFENIETDVGSSFLCQRRRSTSFMDDHSWHFHPEYELLWVVKSEGLRFVGDSISHFQAGDLVLLGPNLPHCWAGDPLKARELESPEWILVQFTPNCFGNDFLQLPEALAIRKLLQRSSQGLFINGLVAKKITALLSLIVSQQGFSRLTSLMQILDLMSTSSEIETLASINYQINGEIKARDLRRVEKAHLYIHNNIDRQISQAEVAAQIGLTPEAFSRFFKKATGLTYVDFINVVRISKACTLLSQNETDISDIAFSCGYQNISNFNRQFLKRKGITPSLYRERHESLASAADSADNPSLERLTN